MKQQAIQCLALDVHQATVVANLRDAQGRLSETDFRRFDRKPHGALGT